MPKNSSFGAILLAYDKMAHEGAQNEPNLPLCGGSYDDVEHSFVITEACVTAFVNNNF